MIHFRCVHCQMGFIARSYDEAKEEFDKGEQERVHGRDVTVLNFEDIIEQDIVAYAKYCPYCGSTAIEAI